MPIIYEVFSKSLETFLAASILAAGIRSRRDSVVRSSIRLLCRIFFFGRQVEQLFARIRRFTVCCGRSSFVVAYGASCPLLVSPEFFAS